MLSKAHARIFITVCITWYAIYVYQIYLFKRSVDKYTLRGMLGHTCSTSGVTPIMPLIPHGRLDEGTFFTVLSYKVVNLPILQSSNSPSLAIGSLQQLQYSFRYFEFWSILYCWFTDSCFKRWWARHMDQSVSLFLERLVIFAKFCPISEKS